MMMRYTNIYFVTWLIIMSRDFFNFIGGNTYGKFFIMGIYAAHTAAFDPSSCRSDS